MALLGVTTITELAFLRAREILRKEGELTSADCEELERLFDDVNGTQFMALTQDPAHKHALRTYNRYVRRPAMPIIITMVVMLALSIAMGAYFAWRG